MILHNITYNVDTSIHLQWLEWVNAIFIPQLMQSRLISQSRICRILAEEEGGKAYSLQLVSGSKKEHREFVAVHLHKAEAMMAEKFSGRFVNFSTALDILHQHDI